MDLFVSLIYVACVNPFVLCTLKYTDWQQNKSNRRHLYLLSVREERVRPHIGRRADNVNVDRHNRRTMTAMDVACKRAASITTVKKGGGRRRGGCSICSTAKDGRTGWKCRQCSEWVCKDHSVIKIIQTKCSNCQEQSNTDKFHVHFVINSILWSINIVYISLYIVASEMKNLNKSKI